MSNSESSPRSRNINRLIAEYMQRMDAGEAVDRDEFLAKHPQYATEIQQFLEDAEAVQQLTGANDTPQQTMNVSPPAAVEQTLHVGNGGVDTVPAAGEDQQMPESFGRYRIEKTLGEGAMGAVYLAFDTQLSRHVALKIPKFVNDRGSEMQARFVREARAAANLRSPNICPVFDVGEIEGKQYITMAYIDGRPLRDYVKSKRGNSPLQVAVIIRKLALALQEAHEQGVVHRDLKPANIMLDSRGEPVVMDFGLAQRNAADEVFATHSGTILGTPAYMSPEQVAADQVATGPQADIYSLGVIMYELLTGELPYKGNIMSILQQIAIGTPAPPTSIRDGLDQRLEKLCLKMMARDRNDRFQTMQEVAASLRKFIKSQPEKSAPATDAAVAPPPTVPAPQSDLLEANPSAPELRPGAAVETPTLPPRIQPVESPRTRTGQKATKQQKLVIRVVCVVALLLLVGLGIAAGYSFFFKIGDVYVKVTIDDPGISVHFDKQTVTFSGSGDPIKLQPGKHGFKVQRGNMTLETGEFTVTEDGRNVLNVVTIDGKLAVIKNGQKPAPLVASQQGTQKPAQSPTKSAEIEKPPATTPPEVKTGPPADVAVDRRAALWALNEGGFVGIRLPGQDEVLTVNSVEGLPEGPFTLVDVNVRYIRDLKELKIDGVNGLESLSMVGTLVPPDKVQLSQFKKLSRFRASLDQVDKWGAVIQDIRSLRYVSFYRTGASNRVLRDIKDMTWVTELDLDGTNVNDIGCQSIKGMTGLERLNLNTLTITSQGLKHLVDLPNLFVLLLTSDKIDDQALEYISQMKKLEYLWIPYAKFTPEGIKKLKKLPELQEVVLRASNLDDTGLMHLADIPTLTSITIKQTGVTPEGIAAFSKLRPKVKFGN